VDLAQEFGADKGFFGFASSPLRMGERLIVQVGGRDGAGMVAFSTKNGDVLWRSTSDEAGYASPVGWRLGETDHVIGFNRAGLVLLEAETGREKDRFPWRARMSASVNAATPWVDKSGVFVTASYGTGAAWLKWRGEDGWELQWSNDTSLSCHYASPVFHEGYLYGFHGRQEQGMEFRCIDRATGKVQWKTERMPAGSVTLAGNTLVMVLETGEVVLSKASPERYQELARAQVLGNGTRALPALDRGILYVRDTQNLMAIDLRK
jgi:outer membrane protein assembly factor BamB